MMLSVHAVDAVDLDDVAAEVDATVAGCLTPDVDEEALADAVVDWVADVVGELDPLGCVLGAEQPISSPRVTTATRAARPVMG